MQVREQAHSFISGSHTAMLNLWEQLVNLESPSLHKAGVDAIIEHIRTLLAAHGAAVRVIEFSAAGNSLVADIGGHLPGKPVLFMGHVDTVLPLGTTGTRPFRIEAGKAYGPGVNDMKGGVVILLYTALALIKAGFNARPLRIVLTGDEENGHIHSTAAQSIASAAKDCLCAFNFEPSSLNSGLVVARKGTGSYTMHVSGKGAHAGQNPQAGRNAIEALAHKVLAVQALSDFTQGLTCNVGLIRGGHSVNSVPEEASMDIDLRVMDTSQYEGAEQALRAIAEHQHMQGTSTRLTGQRGIPPMPRTPDNELLAAYVMDKAKELGVFPGMQPILSGGGSDSAYTVGAGLATVDQFGVMGEHCHTEHEYAFVENLFERTHFAIDCVTGLDTLKF